MVKVSLCELNLVIHKEAVICYNEEQDCIAELQTTELPKWVPVLLHQNITNLECMKSWVTFELHHSLVLLLFVCKMLTRLLRKCFLSHTHLPVLQTIKSPLQPIPDLSWHTSVCCMCLASKVQNEKHHLLLLCIVVPFLDGSFWASDVQHPCTNQPYTPRVPWAPNAWLQCSMVRGVW